MKVKTERRLLAAISVLTIITILVVVYALWTLNFALLAKLGAIWVAAIASVYIFAQLAE